MADNDYSQNRIDNIQDYVKFKWDDHYHMSQQRWQDYYNNIAFYEGYQWQSWDAKLSGYTQSPIEDEATQRIYMTSNLIRPLADTRIAMILGERPMLEVISNDKSAESINQAERDTNILKSLWDDLNVQSLLAYAIWWSVLCNRVFLRPYFDPEYGKRIKNPDYDEDMARYYAETSEEYGIDEFYNMGRLNIDLFTSFECIYDTAHKPWENVMRYGWWESKTIKSIDDLYSRFDKKLVDKIEPKASASIGTVEDQLLMLRDRSAYESRQRERKMSGKNRNVEVYEYYEAPNNDFPDGLHVIVCQDILLYDSRDSGEKFDRIPVVRIKDQIDDKKSLVSGSRQKQKMYNIIYSKIVEYSRFPVLYGLPEGVDVESIMGKAYELFNYDGEGANPLIVQPAAMPDAWLALLSKIEMDMEHYWGIHEITSRSAPPSKGMSGRSLFILKESDVSRLSTTMTMLSESLSDLGELILDLAKKHYRTERTLNYRREGGQAEAITFSREDISEERKVSVKMTSEFKRNKQAYQQFIVQLLGVIQNIPAVGQVLNDPVVMRKVIAFFDEGLANTLMVRSRDMEVQERENKELMAGESPKVRPWDKHDVHIRIMLDLMNSKEFIELPEREQMRIVEVHFKPHAMAIQKQMEAQMMAQQGIPPTGGPQGGGPPGQPGTVFRQGAGPEEELKGIDKTIEAQVQPQPGNYGGEFVP